MVIHEVAFHCYCSHVYRMLTNVVTYILMFSMAGGVPSETGSGLPRQQTKKATSKGSLQKQSGENLSIWIDIVLVIIIDGCEVFVGHKVFFIFKNVAIATNKPHDFVSELYFHYSI